MMSMIYKNIFENLYKYQEINKGNIEAYTRDYNNQLQALKEDEWGGERHLLGNEICIMRERWEDGMCVVVPRYGMVKFQICEATNCCGVEELQFVEIRPNPNGEKRTYLKDENILQLCKKALPYMLRDCLGIILATDVSHPCMYNTDEGGWCSDTRLFCELTDWYTDGHTQRNMNSNNPIQLWWYYLDKVDKRPLGWNPNYATR